MGLMVLNHLHVKSPIIMLIAMYTPACVFCEARIQIAPAKCFSQQEDGSVFIYNSNEACSPLLSIGMVLAML